MGVAENLKKLLAYLSKRGPERVLVGDLDYAGIPGKVYAPASGSGRAAVAFGHDWMTDISRYHATLRHLASWGIVVAAPNTEKGIAPNTQGFASDLETCLQILAGVKLGTGKTTVSPNKLGVVGHGMGGGAAILAAADRPTLKAVVAAYPAVTTPPAEDIARLLSVPGLIIGPAENQLLDAGNPAKVALNYGGPVVYREIKKATSIGFAENAMFSVAIGMGLPKAGPREIARGLITGFLLHRLAGEKKYAGFSDNEAKGKGFDTIPHSDIASHASLI